MYGLDVEKLNNLTVKYIDVDDYQIRITTECDRTFIFYHEQGCCESVSIYDSIGDLTTLKGKRLDRVEVNNDDFTEEVGYDPYDCYTCTSIVFHTDNNTVISRWIGESNGYYSESISLKELIKDN